MTKNNMTDNYLFSALEQYNIQDKTATLTGHNENMAFNVADSFLLRIHKSAKSFNSDFMYINCSKKDALSAEAEFLKYLHKNNLTVQMPVLNRNLQYITELYDGTICTMLKWIDGNCVTENDLSPELCLKLGSLVSEIHNLSENFYHKNILKYDSFFCDALQSYINLSFKKGYFSTSQYDILLRTCNTIKQTFADNSHDFIVVHGDLSLSNLIISHNNLSVIDFSLMGYGHPSIDIASIYSFIDNLELQHAFNKGYLSQGRDINSKTVDIYSAFNELMGIMLHIEKLHTEHWFENWFNEICNSYFIPVINKE